jgi:hypothetical protein
MPEVRFATAQALFDSFPMASSRIGVPPTDEPSLVFLRGLVSQQKLEDALSFCAYLLGRREAVWWACRSVRRIMGTVPDADMDALQAAEAWVRNPEPELRQAAQEAATRADQNSAAAWTALAAAWSGGALVMGHAAPIAPPPELTPHAAVVAILLAARYLSPDERAAQFRICIEEGTTLAESEL